MREGTGTDRDRDRGQEEHRADDAEQDVNDRKLERLTDMEACIR